MKILFLIALSAIIFQGIVKGNNSESADIPVVQSDSTYDVIVEHDIEYAKGLRHESWNSANAKAMPLLLDIYMPDNDNGNRPVFVFVHGGGFAGGNKQQGQIIEWANYYASRGWVFVSINYRLKKHKGTIPHEWFKHKDNLPEGARVEQFFATYPAHRDAKAALRWVVANANAYSINADYITVGGGSAGALIAISLGVSNSEDFTSEVRLEQDPTLATTNIGQEYSIKTIVDLWGSKMVLNALDQIYGYNRFDKNDPPLFIAHGTEDPTVSFSNAKDLKAIYENNGVPYAYYPLSGKGHGAWGAKVKGMYLYQLAFNFVVEQQKIVVQ